MTIPSAALWGLGAGCGILLLFTLHRLALRLEADGHLYYLHSRSTGGAGRRMLDLQRLIDPGAGHVLQVDEEERDESEEGVPGSGFWPGSRRPWASRGNDEDGSEGSTR